MTDEQRAAVERVLEVKRQTRENGICYLYAVYPGGGYHDDLVTLADLYLAEHPADDDDEPKRHSMLRFFIEDGEGKFYCGDSSDIPGAARTVGYMVESALETLSRDNSEDQEFVLSAKEMTDEEVAALPEV